MDSGRRWVSAGLLAVGLCLAASTAGAADLQAMAQGFKDEDACSGPFAKTHDAKGFAACFSSIVSKYHGPAAAKSSYLVGAGFNAWSLADALADAIDQDVFPDITSLAKASRQRQFAIQLFRWFRPTQKQLKIPDTELAKLINADPKNLKPVLDYYDGLPKK